MNYKSIKEDMLCPEDLKTLSERKQKRYREADNAGMEMQEKREVEQLMEKTSRTKPNKISSE